MTLYTLFNQQAVTDALVVDNSDYTFGVQFSSTQPGILEGIWFYSGTGAGNLPTTIALFAIAGQTLIHSEAAAWSGAAGSGWVKALFSVPPVINPGTQYKAAVFNPNLATLNWYTSHSGYWSSGPGAGGITNGPLTAPNNIIASPGQDSFHNAGVLAYPDTVFSGTNYWVDVILSVAGSGLLMASFP